MLLCVSVVFYSYVITVLALQYFATVLFWVSQLHNLQSFLVYAYSFLVCLFTASIMKYKFLSQLCYSCNLMKIFNFFILNCLIILQNTDFLEWRSIWSFIIISMHIFNCLHRFNRKFGLVNYKTSYMLCT